MRTEMDIYQVRMLINELPNLMTFIYPGFIAIFLFKFFNALDIEFTKGTLVKVVSLSFLMKIVYDHFMYNCRLTNPVLYHLLFSACVVVVAYVAYRLHKAKWLNKIFKKLKINTVVEKNEIELMDSGDDPIWVRVYLKDRKYSYEGFIGSYEMDKKKRQYFSLLKFKKYRLDEDGVKVKDPVESNQTNDSRVVIYYDEISSIERPDKKEKVKKVENKEPC